MIRHIVGRLLGKSVQSNGFRGVFRDFAEATAGIPRSSKVGYDEADTGFWYRDRLSAVQHDDYPLLFWFEKAVQDASQVVEIGGHVGIAYYTFERVIEYPKGLLWTIVDVPTVAEAGRKLAAERQRSNLAFVGELAEVKGPIDLLMASGSLQYVPGDLLPKRIGRMANAPRHIILNKTPISDGPGYVTLQNLGPAFCPYRIHGYDELVRPLLDMGYELVDKWQKDRRVEIPGHPERTVLGYSGYYLRKPS